jgi:hypothetical protein
LLILARLLLHPTLVFLLVVLKELKGFGLCRRVGIGIIEQVLNPNQDLFDGNGRTPTLFFVEDGEANGARRIDVGVEERWHEFACELLQCNERGSRVESVGIDE